MNESTRTEIPIWQEPPPPVHTSMEWLKLSGLERLRVALLKGNFPPAPYSRLTGARPVDYGDGTFLVVPDFNWASETWAVPTDEVEVVEDD
jgi:hypothetical protein